ncbi:MAG: M20/M25/M40 family metallo-hydrolase [bacterium]|nr:M20/M25/M40 family metallo-hydrolase [bacterium]
MTNHEQAVARLQEMLRFDTTNPPGNELPLVRHLAAQLRAEGLEAHVLEATPGRASLAVRLRGDGSQRPLLLISHLDVVPAEPAHWTHPPFAGEIAADILYGRGAIDSKLTAAVHLQVLLMAHRQKLPLKRDLVLIAAADEEVGGTYGMAWLAEHHPEWLDAEYGINEAGGFAVLVDGQPIYTCQVAEKGGADIDLVAHGRPGHSSVPHDDNAIVHLGEALKALGGSLPHHLTPSVRAFFGAAAAAARPEVGRLLLDLLDPVRSAGALASLPAEPPVKGMFDAMLRNTCAPTMLEAGIKRNVIPSQATVRLSGRPLPGVTEPQFLAQVSQLLGDSAQHIEVQAARFRPGVASDHETPLFGAMTTALQHHEPGAVLAPYMQTGGTDARYLTGFDIKVYGFVPMRYETGCDFFALCHGHDERVSLANVAFAVDVTFDVVQLLNQ